MLPYPPPPDPPHRSYIPYIHLALAKLQQDSSATMRIMTEAIEQFPTSSVLYQFRGEILMNFQQLPEAEEAYNKALELDSTNPNAYVNKVQPSPAGCRSCS